MTTVHVASQSKLETDDGLRGSFLQKLNYRAKLTSIESDNKTRHAQKQ